MSNKRINIDSNIWGPKAWFFIDTIILSYPDNPNYEDIKIFKQFILSLEKLLPCEKCRKHFGEFVNKNPLDESILSSKPNLIKWILKCHNSVRKIQKKDEITLDDFYNYYIKNANLQIDKETSEIKSNFIENFKITYSIPIIGLVCVLVLLLIAYVYN